MKEQVIRFCYCGPEPGFAEVLARMLGPGYEIRQGDMNNLKNLLRTSQEAGAVLLDATSTRLNGVLSLMKTLLVSSPLPPPVIVMVQDDERGAVRTLIENGAYETLDSPPDIHELRLVLRRACRYHQVEVDLAQSRSRPQAAGQLGEMTGCSESIQRAFEKARKVAACDVSVLVTGETGTGKELMARAIHALSPRASGPFIPFSCANLPEGLIDDELFGHEKGAFTGATGFRRGRFEVADQGTLFLDEIGDIAPGLQAKLLRVLQERSFERLGSSVALSSDVRVVCASHQNLEEMVQDGRFRMDLYFRLNVVQIRIPPLRERRDDIALLAKRFLQHYSKQFGKQANRLSQPALRALEEYAWPGNVRELENVIQRAVVLTDGNTIEPRHLPEKIHNGIFQPKGSSLYENEVQDFKRRLLLRTLRQCKGNKTESARVLGITRSCFHRLLGQFSLDGREERPSSIDLQDEFYELPAVEERG